MNKAENTGINPGVQLIVSFMLSIIVLFARSWKLNFAIAVFGLIFICIFKRNSMRRIAKLLFGLLFMSGVYFLTAYMNPNKDILVHSTLNPPMLIALELGSRIFALGVTGISLCTCIEKNCFIASLIKQLKVPVEIAYSILVAVNFLSLIQMEYNQAMLALRIRGFSGFSVYFKSLQTMIIRLIRQSEYTAAAMETGGFSKERFQKINPRIKKRDIVYIITVFLYLAIVFIFLSPMKKLYP